MFQSKGMASLGATEVSGYQQITGSICELDRQNGRQPNRSSPDDVGIVFFLANVESQITVLVFRVVVYFQGKLDVRAKRLTKLTAQSGEQLPQSEVLSQIGFHFLAFGKLDIVDGQLVLKVQRLTIMKTLTLDV